MSDDPKNQTFELSDEDHYINEDGHLVITNQDVINGVIDAKKGGGKVAISTGWAGPDWGGSAGSKE